MSTAPTTAAVVIDTSNIATSFQTLLQNLQNHLREYDTLIHHIQSVQTAFPRPIVFDPFTHAPLRMTNPPPNTLADHINKLLDYLNTHCKEALTMEEFVQQTEFTADDHRSIDKNRYYLNGVEDLLTKHLMAVPFEKRPIHCMPCIANKPCIYFVKNNGEWIYEVQSMIDYKLDRNRFPRGESGMKTIDLIVEYTHKLHDDCRNIPDTRIQHMRYLEKMDNIITSAVRIDILHDLSQRNFMAIRIGPDHTIEINTEYGDNYSRFTQLPA